MSKNIGKLRPNWTLINPLSNGKLSLSIDNIQE